MTSKPTKFNEGEAHRHFSAHCFNRAWDLIDKPDRSAEQDEEMLRLSYASLYHWTQRPDCTPENLSIAYWQLSRIYAILHKQDDARNYGQKSLHFGQQKGVQPVILGYACEALARAEAQSGNRSQAGKYLTQARQLAEGLAAEDKKQLLADLETIKLP